MRGIRGLLVVVEVGSCFLSGRTFKALSCVLGFLSPMRFFSERIASLGGTVFDLITSEISRLRAMSSLCYGTLCQPLPPPA